MQNLLIALLVLTPAATLWAEDRAINTSVGTESTIGSHLYTQTFTYDGSSRPVKWGLDGSYSRSTLSQTAASEIVDNTYQFAASAGYRQDWLGGTRFSVSLTPKEKLSAFMPSFYFGRRFELSSGASRNFTRTITAKGLLNFDIYRQTTDTTVRRRTGA